MARAGEIIENPVAGGRVRWRLAGSLSPSSLTALAGVLAASAVLAAPAAAAPGEIVFARGGDLHARVPDGAERRLTHGRARDLLPAWSPDRRRIAFVRDGSLHVMRADGTRVRRLTRRGQDRYPAWAPDGRRIARLTSWGSGADGAPGDDLMPDVSPDGRRIAFVSDRDGGYGVWTMAADGSDLRMLVRHDGVNHAFPRFSPDGARLVYELFEPDGADSRLVTIPAAGDGMPIPLGAGTTPDW